MIQLDTIPGSVRKPGVYAEFNTRMAVRNLPGNPQKMLIIAEQQTGAKADPLTLYDVLDDKQAAALFGEGSQAHRMAAAALTSNNYLNLQAMTVAKQELTLTRINFNFKNIPGIFGNKFKNGEGIPFTVSFPPTSITLPFTFEVADNDDQALAKKLAGILSQPDSPVTVAPYTEPYVLTLTQKSPSTKITAIKINFPDNGYQKNTGDSTTVIIPADLTAAFDRVFAAGHTIIAIAGNSVADMRKLSDHLEAVSSAIERRGCIGVTAHTGTLSQAVSTAKSVNAGRITMAWHPGSVLDPCEIAAGYAAVIAAEEDPARPLNTLPVAACDATAQTLWSTRREQENALHGGVTPLEPGADGKVRIVRAITTYTTSANGTDDPSLLDLTTIRTLDYARKAWCDRIALRFPREKMTHRIEDKVRSELLAVAYQLEEEEIIEDVDLFKNQFQLERSKTEAGTLKAVLPCDVVKGLHVFAARIDLYL